MPDLMEWLCLVRVPADILRKDRGKECWFLVLGQA